MRTCQEFLSTESSGPIAGIISAVGVALVGAASSYFAYQKKKLCFKMQGGADPESGKSHQGGRSDNQGGPPPQSANPEALSPTTTQC
ncbi:hypothetical protein ATANTOWER_015660 [Ataeniobius toweri]|uniref:Uncharacterized protein n=1 Tax=Ataeniobius toweri TaxID=208326 RepID=A0ABU7C2M4_9TELE|nr:hypothetical protein [Ataeniobius toweri]